MKVDSESFKKDCAVLTVSELSDKYNINVKTVRRYKKLVGIDDTSTRNDINTEDLIADYNAGMTINQLRVKYKCSHDTVTKRLKSCNLGNNRAEGIRRHFQDSFNKRWTGIEADYINGMSLRGLRDKYKIREDKLKTLLIDHGYLRNSNSFQSRLSDLIKLEEISHSDKRSAKLDYLYAIQQYSVQFNRLPTRRELSQFMNRAYTNVAKCINKYNLSTFLLSCESSNKSDYVIRVTQSLIDHNIKYELNNRKILDGQEIDIWIESLNIGIEINPWGTHSVDSNIGVCDKLYHQKKSLLALEKGVALIHLYDEDFIDDAKYNKIIDWICHVPSNIIGARQCVVKSVPKNEAIIFLNMYHLQNADNGAKYRLGLYYDDILVGILTVGKSRFGIGDYEIYRYCMHPDYAITGSFQKLFTALLSVIGDRSTIVTYMDLNKRMRIGSIYECAGFTDDGVTSPDYVWVDSHAKQVLKRYDTQKRKLIEQGFDGSMSEVEIMRSRNFYRVYGAGSKRYIWSK